MYQNDTIGQNTLYANDILVRTFKIMLLMVTIVVLLKAFGVIALPWMHLAITAGVSAAACLLPIACRYFRVNKDKLKYMNIYCAVVICIAGYCCLNMGAIVLLIIPIGFACLYFDVKLIGHSAILSALGLIIGEVLSSDANWGLAAEAQGGYIGIALCILQYVMAVVLFIAIYKRARSMLSNTHSVYENINNIFSNTNASSQGLETAEDILLQGVNSLSGIDEKNEGRLQEEDDSSLSDTKVKAIISNINKSMENAKEIMRYTQTMLKGKGKDLKAGDGIGRIEEYARNSKELIIKLSKCTDKIKEDISLVSIMIDESKLLSVNAAAEAENASSGGKGSAILAMKVEKLADESAESASHIQELLKSIVNDAENTVNSVAETYEEIFKSLELINRTVETLIKWLMYKNMK